MLSDSPISAVLPSTDLNRSKDFYENKVGLKVLSSGEGQPLILQAGQGTTLVVYYRADGNKAEHTQAGFKVDDIEKIVNDLEAKGVTFEDYDSGEIKTVNHIATWGEAKSAWFKDPDGNIIALNTMPS